MIPRVGPGGSSFAGAGQYYLHDKGAMTDERVAFTHTLNMHTDKAEKALKVMAWTAMHQKELKAAAGVPATGRKLTKPVYTFSLAWDQDETPTPAQMIDAAKDSLKKIGMDEHEVLLVSHSDTEHPHIHAIVNRVHPDTGKAASTSKDHLKLSKWAEAYERDQGKIRVHKRVNHNARRDKGEFVKNENLSRQEYERQKKARQRDPEAIREKRAEQQKADRIELERRLIKMQTAVEAELTRNYGKPLRHLEGEASRIEQRVGTAGFFRKVVRKITGAERRDHAILDQLKGSRAAIEARMGERRGQMKTDYAREWEKMERRHAAEKARDERLIEKQRSSKSGERAGERARKSFRVRAGKETAGYTPAPSDKEKAAEALARSSRKREEAKGGTVSPERQERAQKAAERLRRAKERDGRSRDGQRGRGRGKDHDRER